MPPLPRDRVLDVLTSLMDKSYGRKWGLAFDRARQASRRGGAGLGEIG